MTVDVLIIRNKCDAATDATYAIGEGLKAHLQSKGCSVADLPNTQASPDNVTKWLNSKDNSTRKLIVGLDHGSCQAFYGEKDNKVTAVITTSNVQDLTQRLHMYTFACSTNGNGCIGETAIQKGCYSWLGYIVPVYVFTNPNSTLFKKLKEVIWSYPTALAEGKTMEQAEAILRTAYKKYANDHGLFKFNESKLLLRKKYNNMTIKSHNRVIGWQNNRLVQRTYGHTNTRLAYAIIEGLSGWIRIRPASTDGVSNVLDILKVAQANGRRVNVYINSDGQIHAAYM